MTEVFHELFLRERIAVPFELWIVLVVISLGLAIFGFAGKSETNSTNNQDQLTDIRVSDVISDLMKFMLNSEDESILKIYLSRKGIDDEQHNAFIAVGAITLEAIFSTDSDKQSGDGMVSFLVSKGIQKELATTLLSNALQMLRERVNESSDGTGGHATDVS